MGQGLSFFKPFYPDLGATILRAVKHLVSVIDLKRSNELVSKVRELLVELNATDHEKVALGAALMSLGIDGCQDCSEDMAYKVLRGMFEGEDWLN